MSTEGPVARALLVPNLLYLDELEVRNPSLSFIEAHVTVSHQACDQSGVKQHCDSVISPGDHQV